MEAVKIRLRYLGRNLAWVVLFVIPIVALVAPPDAGAASVGSIRVVSPGTDTDLKSGGPATNFGLVLPGGAHCPGDSAHDANFVWGYLLPSTVDPKVLQWQNLLPVQGYDLYVNAGGDPWGPATTAPNTGVVQQLPDNFSFQRLSTNMLIRPGQRSATWMVGIACATKGTVTTYWETPVVFYQNPHDAGQYLWRVPKDIPGPGPGVPWSIVGALVLALIAGVTSVLLYRYHHGEDRRIETVKETEVAQNA